MGIGIKLIQLFIQKHLFTISWVSGISLNLKLLLHKVCFLCLENIANERKANTKQAIMIKKRILLVSDRHQICMYSLSADWGSTPASNAYSCFDLWLAIHLWASISHLTNEDKNTATSYSCYDYKINTSLGYG